MANTIKGVEIDPIREKLIELFDSAEQMIHLPYAMNTEQAKRYIFEQMADHLIANGVTVVDKFATTEQEWISVKDRLPEIGDTYLVVVKYKYDWENDYTIDTDVAMFHPYDNPDAYIDNRWDTYIDWDEGQQYIHVTHWMPLPEPPKGE